MHSPCGVGTCNTMVCLACSATEKAKQLLRHVPFLKLKLD